MMTLQWTMLKSVLLLINMIKKIEKLFASYGIDGECNEIMAIITLRLMKETKLLLIIMLAMITFAIMKDISEKWVFDLIH